jgi:non-ribosomal peptide synthetase component E (peptide arylation enzyme)
MAWTSGYQAVEVGGTTLHRMVTAGAGPALIDGTSGLTVSYDLLASRVERVAAGLAARGFGTGDVWRCGRPTCRRGPGSPSARWPPAGR